MACLTGLARLPGPISPLIYMRIFSPFYEKDRRSWGRLLPRNLRNKANMVNTKLLSRLSQLWQLLQLWKYSRQIHLCVRCCEEFISLTSRVLKAKFSKSLTEIPVGRTEISVTEPGRPLIRTHRKFFKGFRDKPSSRKLGQPAIQTYRKRP